MLTTIKVVGIGSATDFPIPDAHDSTQVERGHEPSSHADLAEASVNNEFTIFGGRANPALVQLVAHELVAHELGTPVGNCVVERFPDGEVAVQILECVRRKEVFLMQPTSPPTNDHLIELLALADACRRAGAARSIAIVPFFGYGRVDRRHGRREPIMARMVADLLKVVGIDHVVTVDPHTAQIEGFFSMPRSIVLRPCRWSSDCPAPISRASAWGPDRQLLTMACALHVPERRMSPWLPSRRLREPGVPDLSCRRLENRRQL
jgi:ribose phosphate pyrophosphokinase-like protein